MNYRKIYDALIARANARDLSGYKERHHIIPKCIGGDNSKENLVDLTAEEHFVAHQLLAKIYPGHRGLVLAAVRMAGGSKNNKAYGWLRRRLADAIRGHTFNVGRKASQETKMKMSLAHVGSKRTEETKKKMGAWQVGRVLSEETKMKISAAKIGTPQPKGIPRSAEVKAKISATKKGKKLTPEHRKKISESWKGSSTPKETAMKISLALTGRPKTPEHRANLSMSRLGKKQSQKQIDACKAGRLASTKKMGRPPRLLDFGTVEALP